MRQIKIMEVKKELKQTYVSDFIGADKKIRTSDLRITNAPLYQLSYIGSMGRQLYSNQLSATTFP